MNTLNTLSSLYDESSMFSGYYYAEIPEYKEGHCPDSLAWNKEFETCSLRCEFPFYSEAEIHVLYYTDAILACIGFILCYFYCITTLFRPVMQIFPNSNVFFMHFSMMITLVPVIIPLIVGRRYVFCDSNTTTGKENLACILCGVLFHYGTTTALSWIAIFHIILMLRIHLIHIPSWVPYLLFVLAFGSWSLITTIIGASLGYIRYIPGAPSCEMSGSLSFAYIALLPGYYAGILTILTCILFISIRLVRIKVRSKVSWKVVVWKQMRIFVFWGILSIFIIISTTVGIYTQLRLDVDAIMEDFGKYETCVLIAGDDEDCFLSNIPGPPFPVIFMLHICLLIIPIFTFLVFGMRKDIFAFWKEYFLFSWKHKRLTLAFVPSFDPSSTSTLTINTLDEAEETEKLRQRIREL